ncbi:hydroxyacid dehydrogenase [Marinimicrococcus flavescens]|uniref:Hydroxyacid dehydrogenase n=1 Tax=Marinimicrococcus flavescens TaxID=3031815 RepID=A0AAP3UZI0_9PROT|nr:hydroxyacid dehydrogenase [Marinimicrococcus flavescens]
MARTCLIVQPIHPAGLLRLRAGGLEPRHASTDDMATVAREIGEAVAVITRSAGLDAAAMDAAPALRVIGNHGAGTNAIDTAHAARLGIPVVVTPGANAVSVAEHAVALMLAVARRLPAADRAVRAGDASFKYRSHFVELSGKTLGVVGFGRIGRRTAAIARHGLGMRILVHARRPDPEGLRALGAEAVDLQTLLRQASVVSLHLPLTDATRGLIGACELAQLRAGAILVNTGRGAVLDESALVAALEAGRLAGAGLDVTAHEHLPDDHPLRSREDVILTPHIAGSTDEALERTALEVADQILDTLADRRPPHLLDEGVWERRRR